MPTYKLEVERVEMLTVKLLQNLSMLHDLSKRVTFYCTCNSLGSPTNSYAFCSL